MPYNIDNPGGGDCGFYALAIGLIYIIQQEQGLSSSATSQTYDRWKQTDPRLEVNIDDILRIDLKQLSQNHRSRHVNHQLFLLQRSLRTIVVALYKKDLDDKISAEKASDNAGQSQVESSPIFHKFMELVQHYLKNNGSWSFIQLSRFNELAFSSPVKNLAQKTAELLRKELAKQKGKLRFSDWQSLENQCIKQALLEHKQIILQSLDKIKQQGYWATHNDLKEIADALHVNLFVRGYLNGASLKEYPTIVLKNHGNTHWTTEIETLDPKEKRSLHDTSTVFDSYRMKAGSQACIPQEAKDYLDSECRDILNDPFLSIDNKLQQSIHVLAKKQSQLMTLSRLITLRQDAQSSYDKLPTKAANQIAKGQLETQLRETEQELKQEQAHIEQLSPAQQSAIHLIRILDANDKRIVGRAYASDLIKDHEGDVNLLFASFNEEQGLLVQRVRALHKPSLKKDLLLATSWISSPLITLYRTVIPTPTQDMLRDFIPHTEDSECKEALRQLAQACLNNYKQAQRRVNGLIKSIATIKEELSVHSKQEHNREQLEKTKQKLTAEIVGILNSNHALSHCIDALKTMQQMNAVIEIINEKKELLSTTLRFYNQIQQCTQEIDDFIHQYETPWLKFCALLTQFASSLFKFTPVRVNDIHRLKKKRAELTHIKKIVEHDLMNVKVRSMQEEPLESSSSCSPGSYDAALKRLNARLITFFPDKMTQQKQASMSTTFRTSMIRGFIDL